MSSPNTSADSHIDQDVNLEEFETQHRNTPLINRVVFGFSIFLAIAHIYINTLGTLPELWVSAFHFAGFGTLCALLIPAHPSLRNSKIAFAIDSLIVLLLIATVFYIALFEDALYERGVVFSTGDWIFSSIAIILSLELIRRTTGWFIPSLILVALSYVVLWGQWISGAFSFPGLSLETLLYRSFFSTDGMFGSISRISWSFVFMFILFGAFLVKSGAGEFIITLSRSLASKMIGGPGFVAVLGSGLMGSVSGSSVANTVSTGVITIPLMRRAGFPARFAAGIEAAASTGGQLMPPVMGAGAFIMASYTQVSYVTIIGVAAIPALLYFLSVAFFVRVEAKRSNVTSTDDDGVSIKDVLKEGWHHAIPLAVLVTLLIQGFTPTYAAGISILSVIAASWLSKQHRMGPLAILDAMAQGAKNMSTTAVLLVGIGLVVNVISTTGVGNTFSLLITDWAGGSLLWTIILVAIASLVLGMGLPVTASYIVLGTLSAPAIFNLIAESQLVDQIASGQLPEAASAIFMLVDPSVLGTLTQGMPIEQAQALVSQVPADFKSMLMDQALGAESVAMILVTAHMIIFWLSQDSNVTPPVCLTAFAAAAIAKTPPMRTGVTAWKLAKGLYIIPLMMAYTPLIGGEPLELLKLTIFGIFGLYALVAAMEGYLEDKLNILTRIVTLAASGAMLWPHLPIAVNAIGLVVFLIIFVITNRSYNAKSAN
ncbi:TRAP transporter fused permease subunit [Marinomonas mediterranea]|jgi:TRAP transporter, 4TM/12TM fusion protein|uniref:TRAP transporter, 4TM/12TM fusion protein n=1 Tax=Marinomonas mediterranea (strain ATCC 700492 / JCM 21426 / NBRC 103028 / MMB-1) TaxID=717774 RepID=F2K2G0_MARM1|nr:TRAP transporter permease [Marinomonas mediterranea]ADZ92340.1 TRAP transporter, 4TM/12TM fusion protein [Marinomonas mediterranea MMB-1]WCN14338.1 TRAP transporter fused permease subunit [Marinomonas mediterranea]